LTQCMVRPCVARGFRRSVGFAVLHQCIRPLIGALVLRAIMDISAHTFSLPDRPRVGHLGHQFSHAPGRPVLHLVSSSRRPRRETGIGATSLLSPYRCSSFVRAMRPFLRPGLRLFGASRAGAVKAGRFSRPPAGLGLDGSEHGATLTQVGMTSRVSSRIRSCAPC
jgi:hypothetical protein